MAGFQLSCTPGELATPCRASFHHSYPAIPSLGTPTSPLDNKPAFSSLRSRPTCANSNGFGYQFERCNASRIVLFVSYTTNKTIACAEPYSLDCKPSGLVSLCESTVVVQSPRSLIGRVIGRSSNYIARNKNFKQEQLTSCR